MVVTKEALAGVLDGVVDMANARLRGMSEADLESCWFFRWDDEHSLERNIYEFHKMLQLYGSQCRRWEEVHRGSCCVVERVRDTYLMPKIREFAARIRSSM